MIEMIGAEGNLNDELIILGFIGRSDNSYGTTPMCSTPAWRLVSLSSVLVN